MPPAKKKSASKSDRKKIVLKSKQKHYDEQLTPGVLCGRPQF